MVPGQTTERRMGVEYEREKAKRIYDRFSDETKRRFDEDDYVAWRISNVQLLRQEPRIDHRAINS